jgi:phospholipid transport system substrate-binding protein
MPSNQTRRALIATAAAAAALAALPTGARALTTDQARALIDKLVGEINRVINSGKSEASMLKDFERIFATYADVNFIALSTLGPAARGADKAVLARYVTAFRGYISRKYGKRFREFIGGRVEVNSARPSKSYYEVVSTVQLRGQAPFEVLWQVGDKSGRDLFFNLIIEGVNMLSAERAEIGSMLDKRRGDIAALAQDLTRAG